MSRPAKRILVVDDFAEVRELIITLLEDAGYDVVSARDGQSAIAAASDSPVDLLVVDLRLPDMSGLEVAKHLRAIKPGLPVLLVTGSGGAPPQSPPWDELEKPFMGNELESKVAALLSA